MVKHEIGDLVQHKTTGMTGKVIGYGYRRISDSYYLTTLKVELLSHTPTPIVPIAEDLFDRWKARQNKQILACTLPYFPKRTLALQTSNY